MATPNGQPPRLGLLGCVIEILRDRNRFFEKTIAGFLLDTGQVLVELFGQALPASVFRPRLTGHTLGRLFEHLFGLFVIRPP